MTIKKLTVKGESVDYCIQSALQRIGLPAEETLIRIHQREKATLFGFKEAVISVTFDEEQSETALLQTRLDAIRKRIQFHFEGGEALLKVPAGFYGDRSLIGDDKAQELIVDFLREQEVDSPDPEMMKRLIEDYQCQYQFLPVQSYQCVPLNQRGAQIHLQVSEDFMSAKALIFHGRHGARLHEVLSALQAHGICRGIRKRTLEKVLRDRVQSFFEIARGLPAVDDRPGEIEKFFQEDEHKEFAKMMQALTIDMRAVKDINIADRNQLLMKIGEIIPGENGYQVNGTILPCKKILNASAGIKLGRAVYESDNGKEIYSKQSGHIVWRPEEGYIDVEPLYLVEGNVDYSEGNIMGFVGKVLIKGDVKPKFTVVAEGDIEIHGAIEDATVRSTTGSVLVAGGIVNRSGGFVEAKETIHCSICTNADLRADRIIVEKEAMNSKLHADSSVEARGNPGVIVGGNVFARHLVSANVIGSERGVCTEIQVGDVSDLHSKVRSINQVRDRVQSKLREAEQICHILEARQSHRKLSESQEKHLEESQNNVPMLRDNLQDLQDEEDYLRAEIDRRKDGRLEIHKIAYAATRLKIFDTQLNISTHEQYTGFRASRGKAVRYPL